VLVTGGAGFIGSTLVRQLLSKGYQVTVCDTLTTGTMANLPRHDALRFLPCDVTDVESIQSVVPGHNYVVHLAARAFIPVSYQFPTSIAETNALGSLNVFKACLDSEIKRIVHVSSSEVYGSAVYVPMDEQHPLNPRSTYAVSKLAADLWAQTMAFEHKLPVVVLRPFNVFGPRDTCPRFITEVIRQCFKAPVIQVGNVEPSRDFTYVEDSARAILLALEREESLGELINIGTERSQKMSEILEMIKKITGAEEKEVVHDGARLRPHDVPMLMSSSAKASRVLGWKPEVDFHEGLQKTIQWYVESGKNWSYEERGWHWRY